MSALPEGLARVSSRHPCPICSKPDWCLVAEDGSRAICQRVESGRRAGEAGWLHVLRADALRQTKRRNVTVDLRSPDFTDAAAAAELFHAPDGPTGVGDLALSLGVTARSLKRLHAGWNGWAWTFPMKDAHGATIGIRLRRPNGDKLAVKGTRQGLFIPDGIDPRERLLVVEGPTDTAAAIDLGFAAIGRPSCSGGVELVRRYVMRAQTKEVAIFADADGPGRAGAAELAKRLAPFARVRVAEPPGSRKDLREWLRAGACTADVERAIGSALQVHVSVRAQS